MSIPLKLRKQISEDPFMKVCIHKMYRGEVGTGELQWEHALLYGGKQIQESWAIVPCRKSFNVDATGKTKRFNQYIALLRATDEDLSKYPKKDWKQLKRRFEDEFGLINI